MNTTTYKIIVWMSAALIAAYLLVSYVATTSEFGPEGELSLFTGEPRVVAPNDQLTLLLKNPVKSLSLTFDENIAGQILLNGDYSTPLYNAGWSVDGGRTVFLTATSPGNANREIGFRSVRIPVGRLLPTVRTYQKSLATVTVDGRNYSPYEFLSSVVVRDSSNLELFYPLGPQNISSEVAQRLGPFLVDGILYVLLFLASCQIVLLAATFKQPEVVSQYFKDFEDSRAVTVIDKASNDFAIALGLLGTISAIWVALEQPGIDFSSFEGILQILRKAVFTTVLGIGIKMLCSLRSLPKHSK